MDVDGEDPRWNDVGAKWDALVGAEDDDETEGTLVSRSRVAGPYEGHSPTDDGIGWSEDAHGAEFERYKLKGTGTFKRASRIVEEVGPMGELADYTLTTVNGDAHVESSPSPEKETANGTDDAAKGAKEEADKASSPYTTIPPTSTLPSTPIPIPIPSHPHNGKPPGSGTSSSDGSLVDKPNVVAIVTQDLERGRNRALTPVQGNGRLRDVDLYVGLSLLHCLTDAVALARHCFCLANLCCSTRASRRDLQNAAGVN